MKRKVKMLLLAVVTGAVLPVLAGGDLIVTKTVNNHDPKKGDVVTWTIALANEGTQTATNVVVYDKMPDGLIIRDGNLSQGVYVAATGEWNFGDLPGGKSENLYIWTSVDVTDAVITNAVTVSVSGVEVASAFDIIDVGHEAEVSISEVSVSNANPQRGDEIEWTIKAGNRGPDTAVGMSVRIILPPELVWIGDNWKGAYDPGTGIWTLGDMRKNSLAILDIRTRVEAEAGTVIACQAVAQSITYDPDKSNNAAFDSVTVAFPPPTVTNVVARQRWPWNGLVDIDYEIAGDTTGLKVEGRAVLVTAASPGSTAVTSTALPITNFLAGTEPVATQGKHRTTWDTAAAGLTDIVASNVVVTISLVRPSPPRYCVLDLSGGPSAASYPVTYLDAPPSGGFNVDEYKTDKLVLRRIDPVADWNGGTFWMDEGDVVTTLTNAYYMGVFETTQRQWELVMGERPSLFFTNELYYATRPVESISYDKIRGATEGTNWPQSAAVDADSFLGKLRARTGLATIDLPTDARWEFACRAGTTNDLNSGKDLASANSEQDAAMDEVGRYYYNGGDGQSPDCTMSNGTAAVGSYLPNAWGLYDMHGNVMEWCLDWDGSPLGGVEPVGRNSGTVRVLRGGGAIHPARSCTSAARSLLSPWLGHMYTGFRLCCPAEGGSPP